MISTEEFVKQLLAHMGLEDVSVEIVDSPEAQEVRLGVIEEESGLLIGRHAETIDSLQRVVRLVCQKDGDKPIHININDFRERREEHLKELAERIAEKVMATGRPHSLHLTPAERRIIHMALTNHEGVVTESEGEGNNRVLYIRPKV